MSRALLALSLSTLLGCGTSGAPDPCEGVDLTTNVSPNRQHVSCTAIDCGDGFNPPMSGPHCATTLSCRTYSSPQPRCSWVHNLEHGHVVLLYRSDGESPELSNPLNALSALVPSGSNGVRRVIVAPDPEIPSSYAAVVWGHSWLGESIDEEVLRCVLFLQDRFAPEPGLACAP